MTKASNGFEHDKHPKYPELGPPEDRDGGTAFYDSIYDSVAEKLAGENGRRALLIFSDGEDNSSAYDEVSAIQEAQRADVPVFTIRYTETHHGKLNATNKYGIRVMDRIAADTGATAFDSSQMKPEEYFKQIEEDLRSSYEVGYYTTNSAKDGTFRKVVIRAKQPEYTIRAKPGYTPARPSALKPTRRRHMMRIRKFGEPPLGFQITTRKIGNVVVMVAVGSLHLERWPQRSPRRDSCVLRQRPQEFPARSRRRKFDR